MLSRSAARIGAHVLAIVATVLVLSQHHVSAADSAIPKAKNLILLISDGCGYHHLEAASLYQHGKTGVQVYEHFPFRAAMSTFSYDGGKLKKLTMGSYNSAATWSDPDYVSKGYTDSAAASTAMSSGQKTYDGAIGVDVNGNPVTHAWEMAENVGKATGVVTSVQWTHATPAGFVAHNVARGNYAEIGQEMIQVSKADVIMGCGHPLFDNDGQPVAGKADYKYVGGDETWKRLTDGTAGGDADGDGQADPWQLVQTRAEFQRLMSGPAPKRVCGVAQVGGGLQHVRGGDKKAPPFEVPQLESVPTLAEMTMAAINVLDEDPDGFCLMVEGGAIDLASHSNLEGRMIEEEIAFNRMVEAVVAWVEQNSSWDETLLIVTGDHETGYLTAPSNGGEPDAAKPLVNNGPGKVPGLQWNSGQHTNSLIPIFAKGVGADLLKAAADQTDPVRGVYLDNTEIAVVMQTLIKAK